MSKFVLDKHEAKKRGTHYDLRFEIPNTKKWASFSMNELPPTEPGKRLYIPRSNDHSEQEALFLGTIPEGQYGAGKITRVDSGNCDIIKYSNSHIVIDFKGKKLKGLYHLVNTGVFNKRDYRKKVYAFFKGKINGKKQINESLFFSNEKITYKFDDWVNGKIKNLLITGYSGSGKTTFGQKLAKKYNVKYNELDNIVREVAGFDKLKKELEKTNSKKESEEIVKKMIREYVFNLLNKNIKQNIYEGCFMLTWFTPQELSKHSIIMLGPSVFKSSINAVKREHESNKRDNWDNSLWKSFFITFKFNKNELMEKYNELWKFLKKEIKNKKTNEWRSEK